MLVYLVPLARGATILPLPKSRERKVAQVIGTIATLMLVCIAVTGGYRWLDS